MEFGNLAKEQISELPKRVMEGVDHLEETFNANQKQSMSISTEEIGSLEGIPEQRRWKFDWKTVESRRYVGGYISWIRMYRMMGADDVAAKKNKAAIEHEMSQGAKVDTSEPLSRKAKNELKMLVDEDVKQYVVRYYKEKIERLRARVEAAQTVKYPDAVQKQQTDPAQRLRELGTRSENLKVDIGTNVDRQAGRFSEAVKSMIAKHGFQHNSGATTTAFGGNPLPLAEHIAEQMIASEDPRLEAKYQALQNRFFVAQEENRWKLRHPGEEVDEAVRMKIRSRLQQNQLAQYEKDFGVSVVVGFAAQYSIIAVDEDEVSRRWERLESELEEWHSKTVDDHHLKVLEVVGKANSLDAKAAGPAKDLLAKAVAKLTAADDRFDKVYKDKRDQLKKARKEVGTLLKDDRFKRRIGSFKLSPVAMVAGLPVRVHSLDSNADVAISAQAFGTCVRVHVEYVETAEGLAAKIPGRYLRESGDIEFGVDGVKASGKFGKQWVLNSDAPR
ncbi:hypothetical protein Athai_47160 [Actinocatenispora thailandica]|uniref:Uncharacterized protein n=1 Tax=Actinocatenispora thailandica TaxID=227318 RepID=A0A7R7DSW4_9ACTN|nr:hypothetical protein [Actinocatenispora thailandica]BCJ37213.1 hypothetical protein Athai_47160 [Actinocatenispora thailandica]